MEQHGKGIVDMTELLEKDLGVELVVSRNELDPSDTSSMAFAEMEVEGSCCNRVVGAGPD